MLASGRICLCRASLHRRVPGHELRSTLSRTRDRATTAPCSAAERQRTRTAIHFAIASSAPCCIRSACSPFG